MKMFFVCLPNNCHGRPRHDDDASGELHVDNRSDYSKRLF
jgi:hypothetical protein